MARIVSVPTTGSTNADLLALAGTGVEEGLWLRADRQTAGRGRLGRTWASGEGNLYASTVVQLRATDPPPATLALVAGVALAETVVALGCEVTLKWPNDLLLDGAKVSGILLERVGDTIVIGFGVNMAIAPEVPGRPTASLRDRIGSVGAADFLERLSDLFGMAIATWRETGIAAIVARWNALGHPVGTPLLVTLPDGEIMRGTFAALGNDGALNLRLADGMTRVIHAGDVFLV